LSHDFPVSSDGVKGHHFANASLTNPANYLHSLAAFIMRTCIGERNWVGSR
jgi:hypothetical protein